jgi:hypothetical protein
MTENQFIQLKHAVAIINSVIADNPPADHAGDCPVITFARRHLGHTLLDVDLTCGELWEIYSGILKTGKLPPLQKAEFLHRLPIALAYVFNIKKSHNIMREGRRVRGFRGVIFKVDDTYPEPNI